MELIHAERLLTLAYYLKTEVDPDFFDMEYWGRKWTEKEEKEAEEIACLLDLELGQKVKKKQTIVREVRCGTSACALGWATVVFPQVFRLKWEESTWDDDGEKVTEEEAVIQINRGDANWCNTWGDSEEVRDFFGLTDNEAELLFFDDTRTPKVKAKQIEKLVSDHGYTYK